MLDLKNIEGVQEEKKVSTRSSNMKELDRIRNNVGRENTLKFLENLQFNKNTDNTERVSSRLKLQSNEVGEMPESYQKVNEQVLSLKNEIDQLKSHVTD